MCAGGVLPARSLDSDVAVGEGTCVWPGVAVIMLEGTGVLLGVSGVLPGGTRVCVGGLGVLVEGLGVSTGGTIASVGLGVCEGGRSLVDCGVAVVGAGMAVSVGRFTSTVGVLGGSGVGLGDSVPVGRCLVGRAVLVSPACLEAVLEAVAVPATNVEVGLFVVGGSAVWDGVCAVPLCEGCAVGVVGVTATLTLSLAAAVATVSPARGVELPSAIDCCVGLLVAPGPVVPVVPIMVPVASPLSWVMVFRVVPVGSVLS